MPQAKQAKILIVDDDRRLRTLLERYLNEQHRYGSGLGLIIVQRIAKLHNAELTLRNQQQGGAEVTLMLSAYSEPGLPQTLA